MTGTMFPLHRPVEIEFRNPRVKFRDLKSGYIYLLEVELDEELWATFKTLPKDVRVRGIVYVAADLDQPQLEPASETEIKASGNTFAAADEYPVANVGKGPYGQVAFRILKSGLLNHPAVRLELQLTMDTPTPEDIELAVRNYFGVTSRTNICPADWIEMFERCGIAGPLLPREVSAALAAETSPAANSAPAIDDSQRFHGPGHDIGFD